MQSFEPFRVVGSICSDVPISSTMLYGTPLLMVATGRTYQLYQGKELAMLRGGPTFAENIASVAQSGKYRFVAEGPRIHAMVHHKPLWTDMHESVTKPLVRRLLAQDDLLFVLGEDKRIAVRDGKTGKVLKEILVAQNDTVTCLALLTGYGNKLLVSTEEGSLHLYNYKTGECVWYRDGKGHDNGGGNKGSADHERTSNGERFPSPTTAASSTSSPAILSLCCSPYKDIVAYGTSSGSVVVLNVGSNEVITQFEHSQVAAVTALAFRADKDGFLVAGTSLGEVVVWDLENRCMDGVLTRGKQVRSEREVLESAHVDAVHSLLTFFSPASQVQGIDGNAINALLVTGGADNALMQFRFDTVDGLGVLVRERRGHMGSCSAAAFYNGDLLVTAGLDRAVRVTHVFSDRASWELSQGKLGKKGRAEQKGREDLKMPPAVALASSTTRNYQWSSLVSIHTASAQLCGWRMDTRAQEFKLSGIRTSAHTARSVAMSDCGNFAVVGYSSGNVVVINVQNRSIRQLFDHTSSANLSSDRAHEGSVECVQVACGNTTVVSAGLDGCIKMWSLYENAAALSNEPHGANGNGSHRRRALRAVIRTGKPISCSCIHQGSSLLLVAQHFTIRGYHCNPDAGLSNNELRTPVREFIGHTAPITAMAITPDTARHVVSTSGDGALLLWDLAAAACVGQYRFASPATSLSFHPDSLFLATTHAGERGAFLWVNNLRYGFVPEVVSHPETRPAAVLPLLHFPTARGAVEGDEASHESDDGGSGEVAVGTEGGRGGRRRRAKDAASAAPLTEEERAEQAAHREEMRAEAPLFDASTDVALMRRQREHEEWAALDCIATDGLRLSGVSRGTWFNLTVLDQIREKNQPLLPPKKKDVPFFLPTTQELRPTFILVASNNRTPDADAAARAGHEERLARADLAALTPVQEMLVSNRYDDLMAYFLSGGSNAPTASPSVATAMSAQAIDLEIKRVVDYVEGVRYTPKELDRMHSVLRGLLNFITEWLRRGENVDLIQGILADVVRSHGQLLVRFGEEIVPELQALAEQQNRLRYRVDHLVSYPSTLAGTFSGSLL